MRYPVSWKKALQWAINNAPDEDYRDTFTRIYNSTQHVKVQEIEESGFDPEKQWEIDNQSIFEMKIRRELEAAKPKEKFYRWNPETKRCEDI